MKQPKISKELLELVYPNSVVKWKMCIGGYAYNIRKKRTTNVKIRSSIEVVHDIKVYISKNFEKYGMDIVQDYHHVEVMKASAMIKEFWDDEDETYYNPQRVFDAFEWIIENFERE